MPTNRSRWLIAVSVSVSLLALAVALWWWTPRRVSEASLIRSALLALAKSDYDAAQLQVDRVLAQNPQSHQGLLAAAQIAVRRRQFDAAIGFYRRVPDDGSGMALAAHCGAGDVYLYELKQLSPAEAEFRAALRQAPLDQKANIRLEYILGLSTRIWELVPVALTALRLKTPTATEMYLLASGDLAHEDRESIQPFHAAAPADPDPLLALARFALEDSRFADAEKILRGIVRDHPDLIEAHVKLGRTLLDSGDDSGVPAWHAAIPKAAEVHPGLWIVRGLIARRRGEINVAVRCFWEAIRRDPNHPTACYQLGQALTSLGQADVAADFLHRAQDLDKYLSAAKVGRYATKPIILERAASMAEALGLMWEAYGWSVCWQMQFPASTDATRNVQRLKSRLPTLALTRAVAEMNPALRVDLSRFPLPDWKPSLGQAAASLANHSGDSTATFEDRAEASGLTFEYYNGDDPRKHGQKHMYEFPGGGATVVDYDGDGWPDLYLPQGTDWPPKPEQDAHLDKLFRNLGNGRFEDVTAPARLFENRYSHGATAGDFDNDGFPDLYVGNIGPNRCYHNNGDGTYSDVTEFTHTAGDQWTTSCLMADLNGDAFPDIFAVNYLAGRDALERVCKDAQGLLHACAPQSFPGAEGQLYLNLGDGRFQDVTATAMNAAPVGKGLAILAADFNRSGQLSMFMATDTSGNLFFRNRTPHRGDLPKFVEEGLALGVALNENGQAQSGMGIAAGDATGDGLIDMVVPNFYEEANNFFVQQPNGQFDEMNRQAGLYEPSFLVLGFGTQFLDGDLDGKLDLMVANGHVDDLRHRNIPYMMPTQYFQNLGSGKFREVPRKKLGPYFEHDYLGRGMARLDWNRDGIEDIALSHLGAPVALLTCTTQPRGHRLAVQLRGVASDRDAIGANVTAHVDGIRRVRQLTAGDGYLASNERQLVFGLGPHKRVEKLEVVWPSGVKQVYADLAADSTVLLIEGEREPVKMRASR